MTDRSLLLEAGIAADATLFATPTLNKNKAQAQDPEMYYSKKATPWYFYMKAYIGVNAEPKLVHNACDLSGHVSNIAKANTLLHSQESLIPVFGEGITPVSCDKAPVWMCARGLSRLEEKHGTAIYALSVVELVDDAQQINGNRDTSAP